MRFFLLASIGFNTYFALTFLLGSKWFSRPSPQIPFEQLDVALNAPKQMKEASPRQKLNTFRNPKEVLSNVEKFSNAREAIAALKFDTMNMDVKGVLTLAEKLPDPQPQLARIFRKTKNRCISAGLAQSEPSAPATGNNDREPASAETFECSMALESYRDALIDWETWNVPLTEIRDKSILAAKLRSSRFGLVEAQRDKQTIDIAMRYLEIDPKSPVAYEVIVDEGTSLPGLLLLDETTGAQDEKRWTQVEWALGRLKVMDPQNPSLEDYEFATRTRGLQPSLIKTEAARWIQDRPTSGLGYFYLAKQEYEEKNFTNAIQLLEKANQLEPKDRRFLEALSAIKAKETPFFSATLNAPNLQALGGE